MTKLSRLTANGLSFVTFLAVFLTSVSSLALPLDPLPPSEVDARISRLAHVPFTGTYKETDPVRASGCLRSYVTFSAADPVSAAVKEYKVTLYRPRADIRTPVVIVVPTIMGETIIEPSVASSLCSEGMASIIADVNDTTLPTTFPSWGMEDEKNREAILALRTLIDFAEIHPKLDGSKIGLFGVSLGGITAGMMAGIEPERLKAVVITVGAGNLSAVLATSTNRRVARLRSERMKATQIKDPALYEAELRKSVAFDPFYFASRAKTERILMVTAARDTDVPYVNQREQYEAFGRPTLVEFSGGHVPAIVGLTFMYFDSVTKFLKSRFEGQTNFLPNLWIDDSRLQ